MTETFRWLSPLGISVALFIAIGALWLLIGALTVPFHKRGAGAEYIFVSGRTDKAFFGQTPEDLLTSIPALSKLRTMLLTVIAGFLLLAGSLFIFVAWFGLRQGQAWALFSLAGGCLLALLLWALALRPYTVARIPLALGDLPPFMWVPAALILPAVILGWIGL
ncbi:MAG TPA: hypothetical protein VJL34_09400 [Anaerolineales bacterium]|nr:hypothetical protein [Anaerolineales bacterium]